MEEYQAHKAANLALARSLDDHESRLVRLENLLTKEEIKAAERRGGEAMLKILKGFKLGMSVSLLETYPPDQIDTIEQFIWKEWEKTKE